MKEIEVEIAEKQEASGREGLDAGTKLKMTNQLAGLKNEYMGVVKQRRQLEDSVDVLVAKFRVQQNIGPLRSSLASVWVKAKEAALMEVFPSLLVRASSLFFSNAQVLSDYRLHLLHRDALS